MTPSLSLHEELIVNSGPLLTRSLVTARIVMNCIVKCCRKYSTTQACMCTRRSPTERPPAALQRGITFTGLETEFSFRRTQDRPTIDSTTRRVPEVWMHQRLAGTCLCFLDTRVGKSILLCSFCLCVCVCVRAGLLSCLRVIYCVGVCVCGAGKKNISICYRIVFSHCCYLCFPTSITPPSALDGLNQQ